MQTAGQNSLHTKVKYAKERHEELKKFVLAILSGGNYSDPKTVIPLAKTMMKALEDDYKKNEGIT